MKEAVAVIGGGIAGVQAALDVANAGVKVYLIERSASLGGRMAQLDKTFPTNDCSTCILSPKLVEAYRHPLISIHTLAEVSGLEGEFPEFTLTIKKLPRYVDEEKCVGCGICTEKCPSQAPSEFDLGLGKRKAIFIPFPQAVPLKYAIDPERCLYLAKGKCGVCKKICPSEAVDFEMVETMERIEVGAIIVAAGFDQLDPTVLSSFGYGHLKGVITSLEFERLLSASGPTGGKLSLPDADHRPRRIVFVQCAGSRDSRFCSHCSRYCCMASVKQAMVALEHEQSMESIRICHMDMRTCGKDFDRYKERAVKEGVGFVTGRAAEVSKAEGSLVVRVEDTRSGEVSLLEADLVVLAMAAIPPRNLSELASTLGITLGRDGFIETPPGANPVRTTKAGIYAAGGCTGPKDITDSVSEASAAASQALVAFPGREAIAYAEGSVGEEARGPPRVGVFVCRCGTNIASVVDVPSVVESARGLGYVAYAEESLFSCSESALGEIARTIKKEGLNRVVVAACSPRTHEPIFRSTLAKAGVNPYLLEMVNIRDQCSWVHKANPAEATRKASELVKMGVAKATLLEPLESSAVPVERRAVVVGSGPAGLRAAADLASMGIETSIIEKSDRLGGMLRSSGGMGPGLESEIVLDELIRSIEEKGVEVRTGCFPESVEGSVGNFKIILSNGERLSAGAIILAPGGSPARDDQQLSGAMSSLDFDRFLQDNPGTPPHVAFIQCVGVRNGELGCSRFCCLKSLLQAVEVRRRGGEVSILYRDLMFYQRGAEELYRDACEAGVRFFRYDGPISLEGNGLRFSSPIDGEMSIRVDTLVAGAGMLPSGSISELSRILRIPLSSEGFFLEKHPKLAPVEFATDGLFLAGCARYPSDLKEALLQGSAAAAKAASILSKKMLATSPLVCAVDRERCRGCGECEAICKFGAARVSLEGERKVSTINPALCKGCGVCVASCPSSAIEARGFTDRQIGEAIEAMLGGT